MFIVLYQLHCSSTICCLIPGHLWFAMPNSSFWGAWLVSIVEARLKLPSAHDLLCFNHRYCHKRSWFCRTFFWAHWWNKKSDSEMFLVFWFACKKILNGWLGDTYHFPHNPDRVEIQGPFHTSVSLCWGLSLWFALSSLSLWSCYNFLLTRRDISVLPFCLHLFLIASC